MPAITVENPLALPRVPVPRADGPEAVAPRPVLAVSTAPSGFEGEGFPVRRAFAGIHYRHLDPFIMMDQMGEVEYAPGEPKGSVSWGSSPMIDPRGSLYEQVRSGPGHGCTRWGVRAAVVRQRQQV
ncbi:hypothetical protein GCM10009801_46680 [Streptomyces albiaxialis]|uniref:Pirin N-terminal domain-containing protein n=1 Tax=Streptomyces albiaxialis TaxID=329523 RepID=A0ABN2W7I7_9ACTN